MTRLLLSLFSATAGILVWNASPPAWSFDYDESPRIKIKADRLSMLCIVFFVLFYFSPDLFLCLCLFELAVSDCRYEVIQDQWLLAIGIYALFLVPGVDVERGVAAGAALLLWFVAALPAALLCRAPAFGFGDAKLFFVLALALGGRGALFLCAAACLSAGPAAMIAMLFGKRRLPFVPFVLICYAFL